MKKLLLLSSMGLVVFSSESFGARTKSGVSIEERVSPQKKKNSSGKENRKVQKKVKFTLPKQEEMYRPEVRKFPKKNLPRNTKRTFYNTPASDWFKENVSPELLIQEGRGNGPSPQILQIKFHDVEPNKPQPKKKIINKQKKTEPSLENEDNAPPLLLTRGTTFYIPNEEEFLKSIFNSSKLNTSQSKSNTKEQK